MSILDCSYVCVSADGVVADVVEEDSINYSNVPEVVLLAFFICGGTQ